MHETNCEAAPEIPETGGEGTQSSQRLMRPMSLCFLFLVNNVCVGNATQQCLPKVYPILLMFLCLTISKSAAVLSGSYC